MPYPFWDVGFGYGILMAVIAVVHVFVSHFAIGGGLYLVVAERAARKAGDERRLDFVRRLSKFFVLLTVVFGALTGVAIWFIIGLLNPRATEALIHNFVWGWAIEWTFFVVEILAAILYYYGWKRLSAKNHMAIGWIYFVAAFLSLVVINGIVAFMLTPGTWLTSETGQGFWNGFFNPTYFSQLFLRTGICILLAGLFALFVASGYAAGKLKDRLVRHNALWALTGLVVVGACFFWYQASIPEVVREAAAERMSVPNTALAWLQVVSYVLIAAVVAVGLALPRSLVRPVGLGLLALGLVWFGAFEWYRESARKPYVIHSYMYANAMRVDEKAEFRKSGILGPATLFKTDDPGADLFRYACRHCHTWDGYNPINQAFDHTDALYAAGLVANLEQMHSLMPPFFGTEKEAQVLGDWLWARASQRPLASITKLEGAELGARVWDLRCSRCHVWGGHNDKSKQMSQLTSEDMEYLLTDEDGLEGMPVMTGIPEKERQALLLYLAPHLNGGE